MWIAVSELIAVGQTLRERTYGNLVGKWAPHFPVHLTPHLRGSPPKIVMTDGLKKLE